MFEKGTRYSLKVLLRGQKWKLSKIIWKLSFVEWKWTDVKSRCKQQLSAALAVVMHCCYCGSLHSVKILTAGLSSCSASSALNMLSMFHSPKWVYDNSVLQRNLSKDRKRKRNRAHCSWKQRSSLWNRHLWNHEWKRSLLYWLDSSPLQPNPFKNSVNFTDPVLTLDAGATASYSQHALNINSCNIAWIIHNIFFKVWPKQLQLRLFSAWCPYLKTLTWSLFKFKSIYYLWGAIYFIVSKHLF